LYGEERAGWDVHIVAELEIRGEFESLC